MATLLCTILSVTVFSQESLVDSGSMEKVTWFYLMALVHVVPLLPMTFASFFVIASITGASYNWAVVRGLTPFISMGMLVPGYVTEYFFQDINLDVWMVDNGYILYGLLVTLGITLVLSWLVSRRMRESHKIINEHGLVVLE